MSRRYYSESPICESSVSLAGAEAHHLLHVQRATPGVRVVLFDGSGDEFDAEVLSCGRSSAELSILDRRAVDRELAYSLTLGVALPKGDRQRWITEKAVELGVARLAPLTTERTEREKLGGEKLARYVIEASKQCGRNRLMEIAEPHAWNEWLALGQGEGPQRLWVAHPSGRDMDDGDFAATLPTFIAVGPEGGLADVEVEAAQAAGWELIGLGPRILRIETAALALVAALAVRCGGGKNA